MNVTNLPLKVRLDLFNKWLSERSSSHEFDFGNEIDLTKEQLSNPNYIIPEWGCGCPDWMYKERLSDKIGMRCSTGCNDSIYEYGTFLGIQATYEDFYYKIMKEDGKVVCSSCVGDIQFYSEDEYETLIERLNK